MTFSFAVSFPLFYQHLESWYNKSFVAISVRFSAAEQASYYMKRQVLNFFSSEAYAPVIVFQDTY